MPVSMVTSGGRAPGAEEVGSPGRVAEPDWETLLERVDSSGPPPAVRQRTTAVARYASPSHVILATDSRRLHREPGSWEARGTCVGPDERSTLSVDPALSSGMLPASTTSTPPSCCGGERALRINSLGGRSNGSDSTYDFARLAQGAASALGEASPSLLPALAQFALLALVEPEEGGRTLLQIPER